MAIGAVRMIYDAAVGDFQKNMESIYDPMARAATYAVRDVATAERDALRKHIVGAGFPSRWQNRIRVRFDPKGSAVTIDASATVYVTPNMNFISHYETGGPISGKPLLWLPLPDVPKIGGREMTPKLFIALIGPLRSAKHSPVPMLMAQISTTVSGIVKSKTVRKFRQARMAKHSKWVPVFVGVSSVNIRKRLDYEALQKEALELLPQRYEDYMTKFSR